MRNVHNLFLSLFIIGFSSVLLAQEKSSTTNSLLPPGEENARAALDKSPRHGEWVNIYYDGKTYLRTWIVYPERKDRAPVVLIIHEIFGLSDWIRSVADQLAKEGFIAVVPDLISGFGPNGGGSASVSSRDSVVTLIGNLSAEETYKRLDYVSAFAIRLPSANREFATVGFCWGGGRNFEYACLRSDLKAAVVYYGTSPDSATLLKLNVPVLGLYGGDDARVGVTVEPASVDIKKLGKTFEYVMYKGAGHGFLRAQSERDGANLRATKKAWPRMLAFLRKYL
jgi:carboxymethylenebutenolidase